MMTLTSNENSDCHVPNDMLFAVPSGLSCTLRRSSNSERSICIRRPRHDVLQTNARSTSFMGGLCERGLVRKCHECVADKSHTRRAKSESEEGVEQSTTIAMGWNERRSKEGDVERFGRDGENRWRMNDVVGEEGSSLRDAFSSSRAEWGDESSQEAPESEMSSESYEGWQRSDVAASSYVEWKESEVVDETYPDGNQREHRVEETVANGTRKRKEGDGETLTVISSRDLMTKFLGVPGYLLRELIVPISEVGSVLWYDMKMSVIDGLNGERRYFVDDGTDNDAEYDQTEEDVVDMETDEENLSVEERQILEVQESAMRAANKIQGTMIRLFGRLF